MTNDDAMIYITTEMNMGYYWEFSDEKWKNLEEEGYGPILCSKAQILKWEAQLAEELGTVRLPWDQLIIKAC